MFSKELIDKFQNTPTPFYYYDQDLLDQTLGVLSAEAGRYGYAVHYALNPIPTRENCGRTYSCIGMGDTSGDAVL